MLIRFKFKNFRSFLNEQAFSFSASPDKTHQATNCVRTGVKSIPKISKTSVIFGPNASGKSNFVVALETLRHLILYSTASTAQQFAGLYTPCLFNADTQAPTDFEVDVLLDKVRYRYSVSYDAHRILFERLLVYQTGKSQRWFERRYDNSADAEQWTSFSPHFHGPREMWRKATRPAASFLATAAQLNSLQLQPLFRWFEHGMDIMYPSKSNGVPRVASQLADKRFKSRMLALLNSVDIRVEDVRIVDREGSASANDRLRASVPVLHSKIPDRLEVEFLHSREGSNVAWTRFEHESAGVPRLFGLFGLLLAGLDRGKLLVVDDFDLHLHPVVARQVVSLINNPATSHAQLLLVSHNTALMDLSVFRRDEIWLTEVDENRTSNLYTVCRSKPRKNEELTKGYLRGRFGAVPHVGLHSIESGTAEHLGGISSVPN